MLFPDVPAEGNMGTSLLMFSVSSMDCRQLVWEGRIAQVWGPVWFIGLPVRQYLMEPVKPVKSRFC